MATKKVGVIGVDAGLCWIGDPCYILHAEEQPEDIGKNWLDFCDIVDRKGDKDGAAQFNYRLDGGPGLGVVVPTGYGDGTYPVYVTTNRDGRVISVEVRFDQDDQDAGD